MGCGFCESALSNCVGTLLVDWVAKPVGRQLDYLRRFGKNAEQLRAKKDELAMEKARLQREIQMAENQLQEIEDDVRGLPSKANDILKDVESMEKEIEKNKRCFGWCPNWWWRYRSSKNLAKEMLVISKLLEKMAKFGRPGRVGYPSTSTFPTIEFLSSKDFIVSKASKIAFSRIVEALKDDNVSMIGLWGMGGSGKTTLALEVGKQAEKFNLFDKVVVATVSQKPNFNKIQDEIAKFLDFGMNSEQGRRSEQELWLRLQKEKKILIILDDVWAEIDLKKKIGIPLGEDHKGCKVLLTTRRLEVCRSMGCQKEVPLGCLDEQEAWALFEMKAGLENSDDAIKKVAGQIVKKCEGLPIAIVTMGSALKGNTNRHRWEATYRRLKNRRLADIEDINEKNAYICLEVSFDYLKDMKTKKCFLLCSLFPEDHKIYVEDLVRYAWGLELYDGVRSFEEVRSEVLAAIDILKNSCLLFDSGERHVKMHDVALEFGGMTETMQLGNVKMVPELRGRSPNMEYLTITNFEEYLFDADGYNLSSLKKLSLFDLLELRVVWKGPIEDVNFQNLTELRVQFCRRLRYIFSPTTVLNLPQLSSLNIFGCDELEQIIEKDETSSEDHQPICFPNLTSIEILFCANLKSLFPVSVVRCLPKLSNLEVQGVSKLEKLFEIGDEANVSKDKENVIQLPQLNHLTLAQLPNLKSFSHMAYHFVLPSLDSFIVSGCPNIAKSFSVDSNHCVHAITETIRSIDENIVEESATAHETTWSIGSDLDHTFKRNRFSRTF
ncbi:hypothetical protein CRYUN_Cryun39dG0043600 [Craigia yunnanensis]